jgi:competence protein ComEC
MKLKSRIAIICAICLGVLLGFVLAEYLPWNILWWHILIGLFACLVLSWPNLISRICLICLISLISGILYWQHSYKMWNIDPPVKEQLTITGWVSAPIQDREKDSRTIITTTSMIKDGFELKIKKTNLVAYVPQNSGLKYGDEIKFDAKLELLPKFAGFDGEKYWRTKGVQSQIHLKSWSTVSANKGNLANRLIYQLRNKINTKVLATIPTVEGNLLLGLLFGNQGQLPKYLTDNFRTLGISHLTAVSGYNLTIISLWPIALAGFIPKRWSIILSSILVLVFVIFTAAPSSIVRAAIMAWVVLLGKLLGRKPHSIILILSTATFMAILNPFIVKDDAGFILSFLAFFGLVEIGPLIYKKAKGIGQILVETVGAQFAALPYLLGAFGQLTIIGPLSNAIILPLIPAIMISGLLIIILCMIPIKGVENILWLAYYPLHAFLFLIDKAAKIPYASMPWPRGGLFPWYLAVVIFGWWIYKKIKNQNAKVKSVS